MDETILMEILGELHEIKTDLRWLEQKQQTLREEMGDVAARLIAKAP